MRITRLAASSVGLLWSGAPNTERQSDSNSSPARASTALTIPGLTLRMGEVGVAYSPLAIQASGGNAPYSWRLSDISGDGLGGR